MKERKSIFWGSRIAVAAVVSVLMLVGALMPAEAGTNPNRFGMTIGEWGAEWWKWIGSIPVAENPLIDPTGANCAEGQRGRVWFLAGTALPGPVTRSCTVPNNRALFFPIVMQLMGLLVGVIQAYIFAVLATVYVASAINVSARNEE